MARYRHLGQVHSASSAAAENTTMLSPKWLKKLKKSVHPSVRCSEIHRATGRSTRRSTDPPSWTARTARITATEMVVRNTALRW